MKTISFLLCLLFLFACGKNNQSGSKPEQILQPADPLIQEAEILTVTETRNGLMIEGTRSNFAIPVFNITNIFRSRNLVGVIFQDNGLKVRVYNALGRMVLSPNIALTNPRLNIRDDIAGLEYQDRTGRSRYISVSTSRVLVDLVAEDIRGTVEYGVVAVVYRNGDIERAIAMKADGRVLLPDNRTYVRPRFVIDPYVLVFSHSRGVEQIQH